MKALFWLLVIFNLGLFAYFNSAYILPRSPQLQRAEIHPEKITILPPSEITAPPKVAESPLIATAAIVAPTISTCHEWGIFSDTNLANAQNALSALNLNAIIKEQSSQQPKRFWVYKPPLKSNQEAQQKAAEIKALGIENLFIVQEAKWKNAISFGIFEDERLANKLVNELKAKGINNVVKALRNQGNVHTSLMLNNLTENDIVEIGKLKPAFPGADLKEVACP
jgi:hypothetical protein